MTGNVEEDRNPLMANRKLDSYTIFPAKQYVTTKEKIDNGVKQIARDLDARVAEYHQEGKLLQAQRIKDRTENDLVMLQEMGFCSGIENYSSYFDGRQMGEAPNTLLVIAAVPHACETPDAA